MCAHLESNHAFKLVEKDDVGIMIMDGKDERAYAWSTTNYLDTTRADSPAGAHTDAVLS